MAEIKTIKQTGQVFTPSRIVRQMLDFVGYNSEDILQKHIIDNSCGEGAFLCECIERYCQWFLKSSDDYSLLKIDLQTYIHGIEIDEMTWNICIYNLDATAKKYKIVDVDWDVICVDALQCQKFDKRMDFVLGNPPYVRVHNLQDKYLDVKKYTFTQGGMTDLYLAFYELGFNMLSNKGKLCYISPSSWLSSLAAFQMRRYILGKKNLVAVIDLEHYQAFEKATTYTIISYFDLQKQCEKIDYYVYKDGDKKFVDSLNFSDISIDDKFYFAKKEDLAILKEIKQNTKRNFAIVKNGFATLSDKIFIQDVDFKDFTIPILKASNSKWYRGFYPYDKNGKPLPKDEIFANQEVSKYLLTNKDLLLKGKNEMDYPQWYLYGRTQALKDVYKKKIAINTIVKDVNSIKLNPLNEGEGIFSGLYILTQISFSQIEKIIKSEIFIRYISLLKNYKSGGYYTFSSSDLADFLNYSISKNEGTEH